MKTYHLGSSLWGSLVEAKAHVRRLARTDQTATAVELTRRRDLAYSRISEAFGVKWNGCELLDIGSGQQCTWSLLFGADNKVTAMDYEVVPHGLNLAAYWRLLRDNGITRTAKTIVRKSMGVDRKMRRALESAAGCQLPWPVTHKMDCHHLTFADESFDGVFTFSVFEHVSDARAAMKEIYRILRPGGVAYISLELFTSVFGCHDPRLWGNATALPFWAHLRPSCNHLVKPNVYVNKLHLSEFKEIAEEVFDDTRFHGDEHETREYLGRLSPQERAELSDYTDEELCTEDLIIMGRKSATA